MAEAMFKKVLDRLKESGTCLDVQAESASLGPAFVDHDERVARLAREAGLTLQPRHIKCFDEIQDMVHFDLVLTMDKFDLEEVRDPASSLLLPTLGSRNCRSSSNVQNAG